MVDTRRSAAAKRPAGEEKGAASPAPAPAEAAGDEVASSQPPKCAKVASAEPASAKSAAAAAEAVSAGGVAGPLPDTAGLQALTGAMDKLEALLRSREAQSNLAGHKRGANDTDLSAKMKRAKDLSKMAGMLNKGQAAATSRRQEPWCRLISQYATCSYCKTVTEDHDPVKLDARGSGGPEDQSGEDRMEGCSSGNGGMSLKVDATC